MHTLLLPSETVVSTVMHKDFILVFGSLGTIIRVEHCGITDRIEIRKEHAYVVQR